METPVVSTTPTETPTAPPESSSLSEHESQFGPGAKRPSAPEPPAATPAAEPPPADAAAKPPAARAAKQTARNEDVPRIQELTRLRRDAERRAEAAEARAAEAERRAASYTNNGGPKVDAPAAQPSTGKPKVEDFANEADPWQAYIEAMSDWTLTNRLKQAEDVYNKRQTEAQRQAALAEGEQVKTALNERITAFESQTPDFWEKLDEVEDIKAPDILLDVIGRHDKAPELMYYFATHPDDYVVAIGYANSLPEFTQENVALLRRYLNRHMRVSDAPVKPATLAPTPAPSVTVAPRPPTRVQTGPLKTGDEPPGDDSMSLDEHEKYFGPGAKRRR